MSLSVRRGDIPESPPAVIVSANQRTNVHHMAQQQVNSRSQTDPPQCQIVQGLAQPIPRADPLRFMSLDSHRPHPPSDQAYSIEGTSGVAYAGGASSGPVSMSTTQPGSSSLTKDTTLERVRSNTTSCDIDHITWEIQRRGVVQCDFPQRIQQPSPEIEFLRTDSPMSLSSFSDPSPRYRELRSARAASLPPSPSPRQNVPRTGPLLSTPPSRARLTTHPPMVEAAAQARIRDKSLPFQEEDDEHDAYPNHAKQAQERDRRTPSEDEDGQPALGHGQDERDPGHAASLLTPSSIPVAAYYHYYPHSPYSWPGAPPPTPYSHTSPRSISPIIPGMSPANRTKPVLPPYSPVPHSESPNTLPFEHIRPMSDVGSDNMNLSQMDPSVVREQLSQQLQIYALNNGGKVSGSTLSTSSSPFPGPHYDPWTFLHTNSAFGGRRRGIADEQTSTRSSPSHQPVPLPLLNRVYRGPHRRERSQNLHRRSKIRLPPRVESSQPRDTRPEFPSGEEPVGEFQMGELQSGPQLSTPQQVHWDYSTDDEDEADSDDGKWIDEDEGMEGVADDLLQLEFHTDYICDPEKRHRSWKHRWEAVLRELHALDRETNTTLVLLAAPSSTGKFHSVVSRAVRRDSSLNSTDMKNIRSAFAEMASRQNTTRPTSLLEQLWRASRSSDACEEDLRCALDTAIGSLHALESLYEQRERRWIEEKHRLDEEKEKVLLLLKQVLGVGVSGNLADSGQ
ncbi:hypothetical protein EI94DRAFT_1801824 [Lactarius quietus]|nr:hypothetical protein EI94DRAFT_1801824 [Lactarius quietus]